MIFTIHIITSLILAVISFPFIGLYPSIWVFLGGWTVDIDHYIWYIFKYRKFNMFECNRFFTVDSKKIDSYPYRGSFMPFHTIEFIILMVFLSIMWVPFMYLSIGLALHFMLDFISYLFIEKDFPCKHSIILWALAKNKKV